MGDGGEEAQRLRELEDWAEDGQKKKKLTRTETVKESRRHRGEGENKT